MSTPSKRSGSNALQILLFSALLALVYFAVVTICGLQASLAESNLQANLIRASRYLNGPKPDIVLIGSSVAGRLLPEYFPLSARVSNLGLDGSRPMVGFDILAMRPEPSSTILLDTSTLFSPPSANDATLREEINSPGFAIARYFPLLRPEYRLSSVIYSRLKGARDKGVNHQQPPFTARNVKKVTEHDRTIESQYALVRDRVAALQKQGAKIVILTIPHAAGWGLPSHGLERRLADELGLSLLEPGPELAAAGEELRFSDGLHLAAPSARRVVAWLSPHLEAVKESK